MEAGDGGWRWRLAVMAGGGGWWWRLAVEAGGGGWGRWWLAMELALRAGNRARAGDGGGRRLLCQG